ncbi:MAG: OmpA family protein [Bryobacterales bacterium]|nr:OmpA family protein [Bryobacterales bacterium]
MPEPASQPIIVIKKKGAAHAHHGGAWKVAYADFVTAMMAFFMVLWLMNSSSKVQQAVGAYFRDPTGSGKQTGSTITGQGGSAALSIGKTDLNKLKDELSSAMKQMSEFKKLQDHVTMTVTGEGLRIELLETEKGLFFASGRVNPSTNGEQLLVLMAKELSSLPNSILVEGHTDSKPLVSADGYSNWELSVDRANEARRIMEAGGLREGQIVQVRGFADRRPRIAENPKDDSNRRVSIIVQYLDAPAAAMAASPLQAPKPGSSSGGGH